MAKLEKHFDTEYGLPSTHTMSGLLPLAVLLGLARRGLMTSSVWWTYSCTHAVLVACSRLYLGVHSVADILAGFAIAGALIVFLHWYGDAMDKIVYHSPYGIAVTGLSLLVFVIKYPRERPWRASFGTSAITFGTWAGCSASLWYLYNCNRELLSVLRQASLLQHDNIDESSLEYIQVNKTVALVALRLLVATAIAVSTKIVSKPVLMTVMLQLHKLGFLTPHNSELKDSLGNSVPIEKAYCVEVPYR